jgi:hypothetical protein
VWAINTCVFVAMVYAFFATEVFEAKNISRKSELVEDNGDQSS